MDRCRAIALPSDKRSGNSTIRKRRTGDASLVDQLCEATLPARAATARAASRYAVPLLESCGVQMAEERKDARSEIARPAAPSRTPVDAAAEKQHFSPPEAKATEAVTAAREEQTVRVRVLVSRAVGLPKADFFGTADPYVQLLVVSGDPLDANVFRPCDVQGAKIPAIEAKTVFKAQTKVVRGTLTPSWEETFAFEVPASGDVAGGLFLYFRVFDYDLITSDDFLGHVSVGLLDCIVSGTELSAGWRALLRSCPAMHDRLETLRDERLLPRPPFPHRIRAVPGQEDTYDLREAELLVHVDLPEKLPPPMGLQLGLGGRVTREDLPTGKELEQLHRDLLRGTIGNSVPLIRRVLNAGASVEIQSPTGQYRGCAPLHIACLKGYADLAMVLVDVYAASLVHRAPGGRTAAMCACEAGDEALTEWLITEGLPADLRDDLGRSVLFYAAQAALARLTTWLVGKQHLKPGERAVDASTPLAAAVSSGRSAAVVTAQQLLEARASARVKDKAGRTPLHRACEVGDDRCVQLLLSVGKAQVDALDGEGRTALDVARAFDMPQAIIARLRTHGAQEETSLASSDGQQRGESAADAAKREMRARKSAQFAAMDWSSWREARPYRGQTVPGRDDGGAGVGVIGGGAGEGAGEPPWLLASARSDGKNKVPLWIGGDGVGREQPPAVGRDTFTKLKAWAGERLRRGPKSADRHGRSPPPSPPGTPPFD